MTRIPYIQHLGALTLGVVLLPAAAAAQQAAQAQPAVGEPDRYTVGEAIPELLPGTTMLPLTLEQAMDRALEKNLNLKVARLNPQMVDYQLASARAAFTPQLTGTYGYSNATQLSNDRTDEVPSYNSIQQNFNTGVSLQTPWYGGRFSANFNNGRTATTNPRFTFTPTYSSNLQLSYVQPLLRGFAMDQTRNELRTLSVQRQVADIQLLTQIENTKANVRTAYWNLRQAIEQIEIQRRSLELARRLHQENLTKVEIGTLAPIETTTSETQVANAEQALLNAQIQWRNADLALKQLLAEGPDDEIYRATINPIELAQMNVQKVDIPSAVQRALSDRTDLVQARRNLEISQLTLEVTRDQTRPQLDLQTGYTVRGQNSESIIDGTRVISGYGAAFNQAFSFDIPTWNVQFNFTYPLFMRAARANYARAQLQLQQSIAQIQAQELNVSAQVTNAGLAVENTYQQFQAAQKAREVAERNAEAEQTRFDVGMSTNYNVVQAQTNLTTQRLAELRALIAYLNAVAEFDRVQRVGGGGGGNAGGNAGGNN
jgi:outer membrane protein